MARWQSLAYIIGTAEPDAMGSTQSCVLAEPGAEPGAYPGASYVLAKFIEHIQYLLCGQSVELLFSHGFFEYWSEKASTWSVTEFSKLDLCLCGGGQWAASGLNLNPHLPA